MENNNTIEQIVFGDIVINPSVGDSISNQNYKQTCYECQVKTLPGYSCKECNELNPGKILYLDIRLGCFSYDPVKSKKYEKYSKIY